MSRTTHFDRFRRLPLAVAVLAAALILPAAADAQSVHQERALLNSVPTGTLSRNTPGARQAQTIPSGAPATDDGSRALLGRTPAPLQTPPAPEAAAVGTSAALGDGERALLGRRASAKPHRDGDESWQIH